MEVQTVCHLQFYLNNLMKQKKERKTKHKPVSVKGLEPFCSRKYAAKHPAMTAIALRLVAMNQRLPSTKRLCRNPFFFSGPRFFKDVSFYTLGKDIEILNGLFVT